MSKASARVTQGVQLEHVRRELHEARSMVARLVEMLKQENDAGEVSDRAARRILFATFNLDEARKEQGRDE